MPKREGVPGVGSIGGRVVDPRGGPLPGFSVAVVQSDGPHPDIAVLSGADGAFRLTGIASGRTVLAARSGEVAAQAQVEVVADGTAQVDIVVEPEE